MNLYESIATTDRGLVRRTPKKKTIRQRLAEWLINSGEADTDHMHEPKIREAILSEQLNVDPIRLNIYRASGGFVIETRMRNNNTHGHHADHEYRLHIVSNQDGMDLGTELSKILTVEVLRA
jgi:hypothetical protein